MTAPGTAAGLPPLPGQTGTRFTTRLRAFEVAGGRFIGRGRLAVRAFYWVGIFATSARARVGVGVARELEGLGVGALGLVVGASILVGLIATFQVAYQLTGYGAQILSAKALGWFALRELGPIVAALLVVARSAAAIAAEIAAMQAGGELDALRALGLDPVKYLVAPRLAALLVAVPALTIIADVLILAGGWFGNAMFLGYGTPFYLSQLRESLAFRDLLVGLGKAVLFGALLALVAADEGLSVQRQVGAIGAAATRAVVYSLIAVLGADTLVNAVFYFIPGLA